MNFIILLSAFILVSSAMAYTFAYMDGNYRIVGGQLAKVGEFRGQVSLQNFMHSHVCGGILIEPSHVITAAHCRDDRIPVRYVMGDDLSISTVSGSPTRQLRKIINFVQHPGFFAEAIDSKDDIAVIRVDKPFESSKRFGPMRRAEFTPTNGTKCSVVGWGYTTDPYDDVAGGQNLSHNLLKADVEVVSMDYCNGSLSYRGELSVGHFCAGITRGGGKDACQGDSGGLLACGSTEIASGVISSGKRCGWAQYPGVYMDISMYNIWIDSIISMKKLPPYKYALPRTVNETEKSSEKSIHQDSHRFFIAVLFTVMTFIGCHVKLILNV